MKKLSNNEAELKKSIAYKRQRVTDEIDGCKNNSENSSSLKVGKHSLPRFSMSTQSSFKSIKNKCNVYRSKDCIKMFCEYLREHAMKIIKFEKKKLKLLTKI